MHKEQREIERERVCESHRIFYREVGDLIGDLIGNLVGTGELGADPTRADVPCSRSRNSVEFIGILGIEILQSVEKGGCAWGKETHKKRR